MAKRLRFIGGTGGIGRELSRVMAFLGASVFIVVRMFLKAELRNCCRSESNFA